MPSSTQEKKKEITEKMDSKLKKSLKPLNQGSMEFKPTGDILKNNPLSLVTAIPPSTNNEKSIPPNWQKPIVADPIIKKEDPPKKKLQIAKNNDFQPSQQANHKKQFLLEKLSKAQTSKL